eukprot:g11259.t1
MSDTSSRDKSASPVPSLEECDAAYRKARTSLDGRAAPFVPGIGRLSQDFNSLEVGGAPPADEGEAETLEEGYRRGSGGLVVRTHKKVAPLTAALGGNAGASNADSIFALADAATDSGSTGSHSRRGSGSGSGSGGSGGFVVRSHHNIPPLSSQVKAKTSNSPENSQERGDTSTLTPPASTEVPSPSPPPPSLPSTSTSTSASTTSTRQPEESEIAASETGDGGFTEAATKPSAWEQTSSSISTLNAHDNSGGGGSSSSVGVTRLTVSPGETLDIRIFCGTWNVAGRKLESLDDMGEWLDVDKLDDMGEGEANEANDPPDLFAVGFQEVVELSAQNVVMDSFLDTQSRTISLQWFTQVYAYLGQYGQRHGVKYTMVSEQRMLGMYVLVMATEALCTKIAHVQSAVVQTGLGGYFGNKGAVAVRMEIAGASSLCFVCVHMAAHREQVEARNNEYKLITSRAVFADTAGRLPPDASDDTGGADKDKDKDKDQRPGSAWGGLFAGAGQVGRSGGMSPTRSSEVKKAIRAAMAFGLPKGAGAGTDAGGKESGRSSPSRGKDDGPEKSGAGKGTGEGDSDGAGRDDMMEEDFAWEPSVRHADAGLPKTKTVLQADIVFWLGDLNYRIAEDVPDEVVFEMLKSDNLEFLRGKDQLNIARASGAAFQEFQEGPLCFRPTYKYIPGTRDFDNRPEKKVRCPSWCDRVLYSVEQSGNSVKRLGLDRYWSSGPLVSDHMPVGALFRTSLACPPEKTVDEPEMEVESLSPRRAAAQAAFESTPFAKVTLDPPSLEMLLDQKPTQSAAVAITNTGGLKGKFHVCMDSLPDWMRLDGSDRGELGPGETVEIGVVVDVAEAEAAAEKESNGGPGPRQACAMLMVEVDGGGSGTFLPVFGTFVN